MNIEPSDDTNLKRRKSDRDKWWARNFGSGAWMPLVIIVAVFWWLVVMHLILNT